MRVPSGRTFNTDDLEILKLMAEYGFIRYSHTPFTLKSGIKSHVYVFGREDLTDHTDLEWLIGRRIALEVMRIFGRGPHPGSPCLIGIPTAGTALAQAAAMVAYADNILVAPGKRICHRIMREGKKEHGVHHKWVNGDPSEFHTYWTVDNVVTDGQSKFEAAEKLEESGYPSKEMPSLILVDRQQGGIKRMEDAGFTRIYVIYNLLDICFALGELGLWPKQVVAQVEEEIKAHQFT